MERVLNVLNKYLLDNKINDLKIINVPNEYARIDLTFCHWFKVNFYWQNNEITMFDMRTSIPFGWGADSYTSEELVDLQNFIRDVRILPNDEGHIVWLYEKVKEAYERLTVEYGTGRV